MNENAAIAIVLTSFAGCTAVSSYSHSNRVAEYPGTVCVQRAWTHADRIECVKAQIITIAPKKEEK